MRKHVLEKRQIVPDQAPTLCSATATATLIVMPFPFFDCLCLIVPFSCSTTNPEATEQLSKYEGDQCSGPLTTCQHLPVVFGK